MPPGTPAPTTSRPAAPYPGPPYAGPPLPPAPPRGGRGLYAALAVAVVVAIVAVVAAAVVLLRDESDERSGGVTAQGSGTASVVPNGGGGPSAASSSPGPGPLFPVKADVSDRSTWPDVCTLLTTDEIKAVFPGATEVTGSGEIYPGEETDPRPPVTKNTICHYKVTTTRAKEPADPIELDLNLLDVNTPSVLAADYQQRETRAKKYLSLYHDTGTAYGADKSFDTGGDVVFLKGNYLFGIVIEPFDGDLTTPEGETWDSFDWGQEVCPELAAFVLARLG